MSNDIKNSEAIVDYLSVVIPVYNEAETLPRVLRRLLRLPHLLEVVVIDDGSTDGTRAVADSFVSEDARVRVSTLPRNSGKTAALKLGFSMTHGEVVVVQDADLEYDPSDIPGLIQPILDGHADVVYGSRFLVRKAARVLYYYHFLANKLLTFLSNAMTNLNMTDIETGYKAFRGEIIRNMVITSSGFGFEIEVTAKIAKLKCAVYEVPISYYGRTYEQGKKIGFSDGLLALWLIFRFNLFCSLHKSFHQLPALQGRPNYPPELRGTLPDHTI
jgi:glycosyltransferase involved in cell wall biosynthesis